jgi:arabinogalactan oligomer/maltooligosaccharide transport system permease protein
MFLNSVVVSLFYSIGSTVLALSIGVLLSFLLSLKIRGRGFFEALLIMPVAVPPIVVGVLWSPSAVWDDINTFIHFVIGFPYINLLSPFVYFPIMILSEAWEWAPLIMLVAISIISSQPKEINEVASLHGATSWQVFRKINLPTILRSPVMQFVVVLRFIDAMRAFEIPFTWSSWLGYQQSVGSPVDTLSLYLYKLMFLPIYNLPSSFISAVAISLLVVTLLGASILIRLMRVIVGPT